MRIAHMPHVAPALVATAAAASPAFAWEVPEGMTGSDPVPRPRGGDLARPHTEAASSPTGAAPHRTR